MLYVLHTIDGGQIIGRGSVLDGEEPVTFPGIAWLQATQEQHDAALSGWRVVDGEIAPITSEASLAAARAAKWAEIKAARAAAEFGPFEWNGKVFDGDSESQRRLATAAQLAAAQPEHFLVTWTLADNSTYALNASMLQQLSMSLAGTISDYYAHARALRDAIDAAPTPEQVAAIDW